MKTIQIKDGEVTLSKPLAGARNKALIEAEKQGGSEPSKTVFIITLLPHCIKSHPWGARPIRQALDSLEMEEYDKLTSALGELMKPLDSEDQKK